MKSKPQARRRYWQIFKEFVSTFWINNFEYSTTRKQTNFKNCQTTYTVLYKDYQMANNHMKNPSTSATREM
jgi:hypothetical protein